MSKCQICGAKGFTSWDEYHKHHKQAHNVTMDSGVFRLDFTEVTVKKYEKMDRVTKQKAVDAFESRLRADAWMTNRLLNPLIGTDKFSSEPIWNEKHELV